MQGELNQQVLVIARRNDSLMNAGIREESLNERVVEMEGEIKGMRTKLSEAEKQYGEAAEESKNKLQHAGNTEIERARLALKVKELQLYVDQVNGASAQTIADEVKRVREEMVKESDDKIAILSTQKENEKAKIESKVSDLLEKVILLINQRLNMPMIGVLELFLRQIVLKVKHRQSFDQRTS